MERVSLLFFGRVFYVNPARQPGSRRVRMPERSGHIDMQLLHDRVA
jgi:hypothetical protein